MGGKLPSHNTRPRHSQDLPRRNAFGSNPTGDSAPNWCDLSLLARSIFVRGEVFPGSAQECEFIRGLSHNEATQNERSRPQRSLDTRTDNPIYGCARFEQPFLSSTMPVFPCNPPSRISKRFSKLRLVFFLAIKKSQPDP